MELISQNEAKIKGLTRYYTGKRCKNGHIAERLASSKACIECSRFYSAKWREENPEKRRETARTRYTKPGVAEKARAATGSWRSRNLDKRHQYYLDNKDKYLHYDRKRDALKKQRMPKWANEEAIKSIYEEAARISKETGILHHLDHYYPLQGKSVSGLHVHFNLRIIPAKENLSKNNKHPEEFYEQIP
jgi:hypothetical protein